ncbi:hypothetical protein HMPREF0971_00541, partial [Segatella oris F0302]
MKENGHLFIVPLSFVRLIFYFISNALKICFPLSGGLGRAFQAFQLLEPILADDAIIDFNHAFGSFIKHLNCSKSVFYHYSL